MSDGLPSGDAWSWLVQRLHAARRSSGGRGERGELTRRERRETGERR